MIDHYGDDDDDDLVGDADADFEDNPINDVDNDDDVK